MQVRRKSFNFPPTEFDPSLQRGAVREAGQGGVQVRGEGGLQLHCLLQGDQERNLTFSDLFTPDRREPSGGLQDPLGPLD